MTHATLHLLCGKIAAGKSTLAKELAQTPNTIRIVEDAWLEALFADQLQTGKDYMRCAARLQSVMGPHVATLLRAGLSVVMDFPANTPAQRAALKQIGEEGGADILLHVLDTPDAECLARLRARNAAGSHEFTVTEAMFAQFLTYFSLPDAAEGFTIRTH